MRIKNLKGIFLILITLLTFSTASAVCDFTVSTTTVCAGDEITITLKEPYASYHKILILRQNFQKALLGTEYEIVAPYTDRDNEIKIRFRGTDINKTFYIAMSENQNADIPCGNKLTTINLKSSPDPQLTEIKNFSRCSGTPNPEELSFTDASTSTNNIKNYKIDWGDGSPAYNSATAPNAVTHTYNPGSYTVTYTITGTGYSCNNATKTYGVLVGKGPTIYPILNQPTQCAPTNYNLPFDVAKMVAENSPSTIYKLYVNDELQSTYDNKSIPLNYTYFFEEGSCGYSSSCPQTSMYSIKMESSNECDFTFFQQCIIVKDSVKPEISGKDTVCVDQANTFMNTDKKSRVFVGTQCTQFADHTWSITPSAGVSANPVFNTPVKKNSISITFSKTGNYRLKLKVDGDCNTKDTFFDIVVVEPIELAATFTPPGCIPENPGYVDVPFTSQIVTGVPKDYKWAITGGPATFVGGTSASSKDVVVRFPQAGNYKVSLTSSSSTCPVVSWTSPTIVVKTNPKIDTLPLVLGCSTPFTFKNDNGTPLNENDDFYSFYNGNDGTTKYQWTFDSGNPSSVSSEKPGNIVYNTPGTFDIITVIRNQCGSDSISRKITIYDNVKPTLGKGFDICISAPPIQLPAASPAGGSWSGPGITDVNLGVFNPALAGSGKQTVRYTINQSTVCPTFEEMEINVIEILGFNAGPNQEVCKGTILKLENDPNFPGGNWTGTGVSSSVLNSFDPYGLAPGTYPVTYTYKDPSGQCSMTAMKNILVKDSIHFTPPPNLCVNVPFEFGSISDNIALPVDWDFGDGSPHAFVLNPTHNYTTSGIKNIILKANTIDGCAATLKFSINVKENAKLNFNVSPATTCTGEIMVSFPKTHDPASLYTWTYDNKTLVRNDSSAFLLNFSKPVLADSIYKIELKANYFCGSALAEQKVTIKSDPVADFNIQSIGCEPFNPVLTNNAFGSSTTYHWDFGIPGQTSQLPNPTPPTYYNSSRNDTTYIITQTVSNACGTDKISKIITVRANTTYAAITQDKIEGCSPLEVQFESVSSSGSLSWDFGDNTSGFSEFQPKTYTQPGTYIVKLEVQGNCGKSSATSKVTVHPQPTVDFSVKDLCLGKPTKFTPILTNTAAVTWNFGDGNFSSQMNPSYSYLSADNFDVKLKAFTNKGCSDSITKIITIANQPKAGFNIDNPSVCLGVPVTLLNASNSAGSPNFTWDFGDGTFDNNAQPEPHNYLHAGTYSVSLLAVEGLCRDSIKKPNAIRVFSLPNADFTYTIDHLGKFQVPVIFNNISSLATKYVWLFNGKDSSFEKNPTFLFNNLGPNRVILYAENANGCIDTVIKLLAVDFDGAVFVPNVFAPELGSGESTLFKPKGVDLKEYHVQVFSTYGQLLWESTKLENGQPSEAWDGRYKGEIMPQDVYVWKIRAIFKSGKAWEGNEDINTGKKTTMGSVILLR